MDKRKNRRLARQQGALARRERDEVTWNRRAQRHADEGDMDKAKWCYHKAELAAQDVKNLAAKGIK